MADHSNNRDDPWKPLYYTQSDNFLDVENRDPSQESPSCCSSTADKQTTNIGAQICEWPVSGLLKRKYIGREARYIVEFSLGEIQDLWALELPPKHPSVRADKNRKHTQEDDHGSARPYKSRKYTKEEDDLLVDLKENKGLSWKDIQARLPDRGQKTLQVHYATKLKQRMSPS